MIYFAHRGLSEHAPENTMAAFWAAVKAGAEAIELDVQRTKDGRIVVLHDFYLGRTNNGQGLLKERTYEELSRLDAGSWFSERFAGEKLPLLEEVLQALPPELLINIELKKLAIEPAGDFAAEVVELLRRYPRPVLISSFDHYLLKEVQRLDDTLPLGLLYGSGLIDVFAYAEQNSLKIAAIHPAIEYVSPELITRAHQRGIKVNVYTVRRKEEAELLKACGADGIFVNTFDILDAARGMQQGE